MNYHCSAYIQQVNMGKRTPKDCPMPDCGSRCLVKLSYHLAQVHHLSPKERKYHLQEVKFQKLRRQQEGKDQQNVHDTNLLKKSLCQCAW